MKKIITVLLIGLISLSYSCGVSFAQNDNTRTPPTINVPTVPSQMRQPPMPQGGAPANYTQQTFANPAGYQAPVPPAQNILPAPALFSQMVGKLTYKELNSDGTYTLGIMGNVFDEEVKIAFKVGTSQVLVNGQAGKIEDLKIGDPVNAVYQGSMGTDKLSEVIIISVIPQEFLDETEADLKQAYDKDNNS